MEVISNVDGFTFRMLRIDDFDKGYKELLSDLTVPGDLNDLLFREIFQYRSTIHWQYFNIVIEENESNILVGNGVLVVRQNLLKKNWKTGLIEDIVVLKRLQGKGFGKKIIDCLLAIAKANNCKDVVLDCSETNEGFYNKCGLTRKGSEMGLYF